MESIKRAAAGVAGMVTPSSDEAAAQIGAPSAADAMWAAMMIPHHRTGIQTAEMAVSRATTAALQRLAAHSKAEQEQDLPRLERILSAAGKQPMPPESQIERMEKQQMQTLQALSGVDFDRYWITVVSGHHMSAVMMTDTAMAGSSSAGAMALQQELRQKQLEELGRLNELRDQLGD